MLINLITAIMIVWFLGIIPMFLVFKKIMTTGQEWESAGSFLRKHYINNCVMAACSWPLFMSWFTLSHLWDSIQKE